MTKDLIPEDHICNEYLYERDGELIIEELCVPSHHTFSQDSDYRDYLHEQLEKWLNESNGTGYFVLGKEAAESGQRYVPSHLKVKSKRRQSWRIDLAPEYAANLSKKPYATIYFSEYRELYDVSFYVGSGDEVKSDWRRFDNWDDAIQCAHGTLHLYRANIEYLDSEKELQRNRLQ